MAEDMTITSRQPDGPAISAITSDERDRFSLSAIRYSVGEHGERTSVPAIISKVEHLTEREAEVPSLRGKSRL